MEDIMKSLAYGTIAIALAALTTACGYSERTYAVAAPNYERPVAVPGAEYYGDRYYSGGYYYYPTRTSYVRYY
jgi:hypothetical protein